MFQYFLNQDDFQVRGTSFLRSNHARNWIVSSPDHTSYGKENDISKFQKSDEGFFPLNFTANYIEIRNSILKGVP